MTELRLWLAKKILPAGYKISRVVSGWKKRPKEPVKVEVLPIWEDRP